MKRHPNLILAFLFAATAALAAWQGQRVMRLRESEAFYRWILATATSFRMGWEESASEVEAFYDSELFENTNQAAAAFLPPAEAPGEAVEKPVPALALVSGEMANDKLIWDLAKGAVLEEQRNEFLELVRDRKLQYAKDIQFAEAQASGVNLFNFFFGFRKVVASFIWVQVDRYWHSGMLYRMVPLMNTVVTLDPNFIDAYLVGAWHLAYNATAGMPDTPMHLREWSEEYQACIGRKERYLHMAIAYLRDGIRKNPRNYKLYFDLGFAIYKEKMKDYENAVKYLAEAIKLPHELWVPRQLYICMELNGQYEEARAGWQDYMRRFPTTTTGSDVAPRFIKRNTGKIYEARMEAARAEAEAATEAEAEAKRAESEEWKKKALEIWNSMADPYAEARKLRIVALDLAEEERYLEAIALLDKARWESGSFFEEASDQIIKIKQKAAIPLSVSEKKAVLREETGEDCPGKPADA
jgi:hypothetical protein